MFTKNTFRYFDAASENKFSKQWFNLNKSHYEENVKNPFNELIESLKVLTPGYPFEINRLSRPVRPKDRHLSKGISKDFASIIVSQKKKSRYEHPPCLHIQLGSLDLDNFIKVGMYITNSKQTKVFRSYIGEELDQIVKKTQKSWGEIQGEKYKRVNFEINKEYERYFYLKNFYFVKYFSREDVISKDFTHKVVRLCESAYPFYQFLEKIM